MFLRSGFWRLHITPNYPEVNYSPHIEAKMNSELRLVRLSDKEEIQKTHENNRVEWGPFLSLEDYCGREATFAAQALHDKYPVKYWALQVKEGDDWNIVAHMESNYMPALYKKKGEQVKETWAHGVMSVFTPPNCRGKGYATQMLTRVVKSMDEELSNSKNGDDEFVVLWSDIGDYYSKFGFELYDARQLEMKLSPTDQLSWPEGVKEVGLDDLKRLGELDQNLLEQLMNRDTEKDGVTRVALKPSEETFGAGINRATYVGEKITGKKETVFGAQVNDSFVIWVQDWGRKKIDVVRLHVPLEKSVEGCKKDVDLLMKALLAHAHKRELLKALLWVQDFPEQLDSTEMEKLGTQSVADCKLAVRDSSVPMVRLGKNLKGAKWLWEGKYACY